MSRAPAKPDRHPLIGRKIRIRCEAEVLNHFPSGPTVPERVSVFINGMTTVVPVSHIEVTQ